MPRLKSALPRLLPLALVMLLTACSVVSKPSLPSAPTPPATQPPQIPALLPEARQPKTQALCSPNCSEGWRKLLESLLP